MLLCVGGFTNLNIQSGLNNCVIFRPSQRNSALCKCFHFSLLATKLIVTALFLCPWKFSKLDLKGAVNSVIYSKTIVFATRRDIIKRGLI